MEGGGHQMKHVKHGKHSVPSSLVLEGEAQSWSAVVKPDVAVNHSRETSTHVPTHAHSQPKHLALGACRVWQLKPCQP